MDFLKLIETAQSVARNPRFNDDTINNCTIAGLELKQSRQGGKVFLIVDLLIDESVAKTPTAVAHKPGAVVTDMVTMTDDWGPGKAKEIVLAAIGANEKELQPGQFAKLLQTVMRPGSFTAEGGINGCRGTHVRVETVPYTTKKSQGRQVTRYTNIPTSIEQVKANAERLTASGIK